MAVKLLTLHTCSQDLVVFELTMCCNPEAKNQGFDAWGNLEAKNQGFDALGNLEAKNQGFDTLGNLEAPNQGFDTSENLEAPKEGVRTPWEPVRSATAQQQAQQA